jgi:dTDP-4-dehydrorhamnose 3,5-epimerase
VIFTAMPFEGAYIIEPDALEDERGFFARTWCQREFQAGGLNPRLVQCSISFNRRKGSLRGMHYQVAPCEEAKLVRCTMGAIQDVIIDLRPWSPTFKQHLAVVLTARNRKMLYVPEGFAHGFQTLEDYAPECARGVRWDDPAFGIEWPVAARLISERDRTYPDYSEKESATA